ncbi:MAG: RnfABCDGE type electron transport complex subunit D [Clostridia bacterium]|nr:RnfABCDGE type electron transport complex subunit D [Clostridia bacterium]
MRLVVGASPHIHHEENITIMMGDMLVALIPMVVMAGVYYGMRALLLIAISMVSSLAFEYVYTRIYGKIATIGDLSAVVTGVIIACNLPATVPLWFPVAGAFFAIIIVKQLFGGIGRNVFNPALAAIVFLTVTWPGIMSVFPLPSKALSIFGSQEGYTTNETVLSSLRQGLLPNVSYGELFWGSRAGCMGTCAALVILIAALYLFYRRLINWQIPVAFLGTVALFACIFPRTPASAGRPAAVLYELLSGSLLFIALFMATDPATGPISAFGRLAYGVLCGLLTVLIRRLGVFPEGAYFALLLVNPFSMPLDRLAWKLKVKKGELLDERK